MREEALGISYLIKRHCSPASQGTQRTSDHIHEKVIMLELQGKDLEVSVFSSV